jgi:hypothetical protein
LSTFPPTLDSQQAATPSLPFHLAFEISVRLEEVREHY